MYEHTLVYIDYVQIDATDRSIYSRCSGLFGTVIKIISLYSLILLLTEVY